MEISNPTHGQELPQAERYIVPDNAQSVAHLLSRCGLFGDNAGNSEAGQLNSGEAQVAIVAEDSLSVIKGSQGEFSLRPGNMSGLFNALVLARSEGMLTSGQLAELGFCKGDSHEVTKLVRKLSKELELAVGESMVHTFPTNHGRHVAYALSPKLRIEGGIDTDERSIQKVLGCPVDLNDLANRYAPKPKLESKPIRRDLHIPADRILSATELNRVIGLTEEEKAEALELHIIGLDRVELQGVEIRFITAKTRAAFNALISLTCVQPRSSYSMNRHIASGSTGSKKPKPQHYSRIAGILNAIAGGPPVIREECGSGKSRLFETARPLRFTQGEKTRPGRLVLVGSDSPKDTIYAPVRTIGREALKLDMPEAFAFSKDGLYKGAKGRKGYNKMVARYFSGQEGHRLLTRTGEIALAQAIEAGVLASAEREWIIESGQETSPELLAELERLADHGEQAKASMLQANLPLAAWVAGKYYRAALDNNRREADYETLLQEATVGLVTAIERFDYTRDNGFAVYAHSWIRQKLVRHLKYVSKVEYDERKDVADKADDTRVEQCFQEGQARISILAEMRVLLSEQEIFAVASKFGLELDGQLGEDYNLPERESIIQGALLKLAQSESLRNLLSELITHSE